MAFARLNGKHIWHYVQGFGNTTVCGISVPKGRAKFSKVLECGPHRLCEGCAAIMRRGYQPPAERRRTSKRSPRGKSYYDQHMEAKAAEARGDFADMPHTEEIVAWVEQNRPLSEMQAFFYDRTTVRDILGLPALPPNPFRELRQMDNHLRAISKEEERRA